MDWERRKYQRNKYDELRRRRAIRRERGHVEGWIDVDQMADRVAVFDEVEREVRMAMFLLQEGQRMDDITPILTMMRHNFDHLAVLMQSDDDLSQSAVEVARIRLGVPFPFEPDPRKRPEPSPEDDE